jgi:exodeoxyribonuclease V beta subunit
LNIFDVLDRTTDVNRAYFLEASAGTGKTFAIEHLVVRQLIEGKIDGGPITIDQIAIVTFTRAAARELRARIHASIASARSALRDGSLAPHDYLRAVQEDGPSAVRFALQRLEGALSLFDEASIGTIHSFCLQALREHGLEAGVGYDLRLIGEALDPLQQLRIVRDFLRLENSRGRISAGQLQRAIGLHRGDLLLLENEILRRVLSNEKESGVSPFGELFQRFLAEMRALVDSGIVVENLRRSFLEAASNYRETCDRSGSVHLELQESLDRFLLLLEKQDWDEADFDLLVEEGIVYLDALHPSLLRAGKSARQLPLGDRLSKSLAPLIAEARNPDLIVGRLVADCGRLMGKYLDDEEIATPDQILELMGAALEKPAFQERLLRKHRIAIIDEFQDTDPLQWKIFSTLFSRQGRLTVLPQKAMAMTSDCGGHLDRFAPHSGAPPLSSSRSNQSASPRPGVHVPYLSEEVRLILVGDPKQSIYAFRKADIYCYLEAMESVGESGRYSLGTNYRALPELVDGINLLFSQRSAPGLFSLPRAHTSLSAEPCGAGVKGGEEGGVIHFFIANGKRGRSKKWPTVQLESEQLFPFMAGEIIQLDTTCDRCAVLVRDWEQGERVRRYLSECGIRASSWRKVPVGECEAYRSLRAIMEAALYSKDLDRVRSALATPVVGWSARDLEELARGVGVAKVAARFSSLGDLLRREGLYPFFDRLMGEGVLPNLLKRQGGKELYQKMRQIVSRLVERQVTSGDGAEELFQWMITWEKSSEELPPSVDNGAVQILTIHASKGLEFDIVFALGVANRTVEEEHGEEADAEKGRQLYVALTRARKRVYVPLILEEEGEAAAPGTAAPIELLMARLGEEEKSYDEVLKAIPKLTLETVHRKLRELELPSICWTDLQGPFPQPRNTKEASRREVVPPKPLLYRQPEVVLNSFTTLAKKGNIVSKRCEAGLPAGAESGKILHGLLERVDLTRLKQVSDPSLLAPWVAEQIESTSLEGWEEEAASLVWRAFYTPIAGFRLVDLPHTAIRREMEFYHPYHNGAMVGVVDLFCEHQGKYYLVDWKSNSLSDYDEESLREEMEANDYFLQAELYQEAVRRLISLCDKRPFEECFGGTYYLFLRGLEPETGRGLFRA